MDPCIDKHSGIRRAHSRAAGARAAAAEFHAAVAQEAMALVVFFCSPDYDLDLLASEIGRLFAGVQVIGCTTAGEIGPAGYLEHSLCGASFAASEFVVVSACIENLQQFDSAAGQAFARDLQQRLAADSGGPPDGNGFALLLIDGLSVREEPVTRAVQSVLAKMPLVGGSAGDGTAFARTRLYFDGRFRSDCAILALLSTRLPVKVFETHHFVATDERLVVTEADPARRIVREINGLPATQEYARVLGVDVAELGPRHFSAWPVVVLIDGVSYVRSIQKAADDGSLTFYCAIENGMILRIARSGDLLENLRQKFAEVRAAIGQPQLVLAFDCHLRRIEICAIPQRERIVDLMLNNHCLGFCTYGEQYRGVHINQTLTGVAIGRGAPPPVGSGDA